VKQVIMISLLLLVSGCYSPGEVIQPRPVVNAPPLKGIWHVVRKGETVKSLSKRCRISANVVRELNGLDEGARLRVGESVFLHEAKRKICNRKRKRRPPPPPPAKKWTWPVKKGTITSRFGVQRGKRRRHRGVDIAARTGTKIVAARKGTVIFSGTRGNYGRVVIIEHSGEYVTVYAHNSKNIAELGDEVAMGQKIGEVGSTGRSTGPHLHFEIRYKGTAVDPMAKNRLPPGEYR